MKIVCVASECAPFVKVGGLGDAVFGLLRGLSRTQEDITCILPYYAALEQNRPDLEQHASVFMQFQGKKVGNTLWSTRFKNIFFLFVEPQKGIDLFKRDTIYGEKDDATRFMYFSTAVFAYLSNQPKSIDVLHLHDWMVALLAPLVRSSHETKVGHISLSIHNLDHWGICKASTLSHFPLTLFGGRKKISLLQEGVLSADSIITVSPSYAKEIIRMKSNPLAASIRTKQSRFCGILNGLDLEVWNPETDPYLAYPYSLANLEEGKRENRLSIGLKSSGICVGVIGRLVPQKGLELLYACILAILKARGHVYLLGDTNKPEHKKMFTSITHPNYHPFFTFDEALAHRLYGAIDLLLMPSRFEPCGLSQMIAMRYGALPLVYKTGGLADSVDDTKGFVFEKYTKTACLSALERARNNYFENRQSWQAKQRAAMTSVYGWDRAARAYIAHWKKGKAIF